MFLSSNKTLFLYTVWPKTEHINNAICQKSQHQELKQEDLTDPKDLGSRLFATEIADALTVLLEWKPVQRSGLPHNC